jgi:hypothetical protein
MLVVPLINMNVLDKLIIMSVFALNFIINEGYISVVLHIRNYNEGFICLITLHYAFETLISRLNSI